MISRRTDYALRCLVELVAYPAGEYVATAALAKKLKVSKIFLAKIFQQLTGAKIIESEKWKGGGVRLKSADISLARLLVVLEPEFCLNKCLNRKFKCFRRRICPIHHYL